MTITLHQALLEKRYQLTSVGSTRIYQRHDRTVYSDAESVQNIILSDTDGLEQSGTLALTRVAPMTITDHLRTSGSVWLTDIDPFTCDNLTLTDSHLRNISIPEDSADLRILGINGSELNRITLTNHEHEASLYIIQTNLSRLHLQTHAGVVSVGHCYLDTREVDLTVHTGSELSYLSLSLGAEQSVQLTYDARRHLNGTSFDVLGHAISYCQLQDNNNQPWLKLGSWLLPAEEVAQRVEAPANTWPEALLYGTTGQDESTSIDPQTETATRTRYRALLAYLATTHPKE